MSREPFGAWVSRYWHIIASITAIQATAFLFLYGRILQLESEMSAHRLLSEYTIVALCVKPDHLDVVTRSLLQCSRRIDQRQNLPPVPPSPSPQ